MRVFVLNTGRCGSTTFIQACSHIENFSSGHETRAAKVGVARLDYPDRHIEADNRLSWFLGRLDDTFGAEAFYVHLFREPKKVTDSFARRQSRGIMRAYERGILLASDPRHSALAIASDYVETVEANIRFFLKDKPLQMSFHLEGAAELFPQFCERIGAEVNIQAAIDEFSRNYNATEPSVARRLLSKLTRPLATRR